MRAFSLLIALAFAGSATAADEAPTLAVGKFQDGNLVMEVTKQVPVTKEEAVTVIINGQQVQQKRTVTVYENVQQHVLIPLKGAKVTMGGKVLTEKELGEKFGESRAIVTSQGPVAEKFRKLFKDDAILIEFPVPEAPKK